MKEDLREGLDGIREQVVNIINCRPLSIANSIYNISKEIKSLTDKILLQKLVYFIICAETLSEDAEAAFDKRVMFGSENDAEFFMELLLCLDKLDQKRKIKFFAMLCNARIKNNLDIGIYEKIYNTIFSCTVSELEYIKENIQIGISEKENTITIFSLMQGGLVQKKYNEKQKANSFYFTEYARLVYDYALNYNGKNDGKQISLHNITIREDDYAINKVARLEDGSYSKEKIIISDIKSSLNFSEKYFNLQFTFANSGIKVEPARLFFAFTSSSGYYVCERFKCAEYFNFGYFEENTYNIQHSFDKQKLKSCDEYGIIFYFKVINQEERYVKVFRYNRQYTSQEISKEAFEKEIQLFDNVFIKIESSSENAISDYILKTACLIMDYEYTK